MTQEIQNQIVGAFWGMVPIIVVFLVIAALLGIGYKLLEKKLISWAKRKKAEKEQKQIK